MFLKTIKSGVMDVNCYILGDKGEAAVIDPGMDCRKARQVLEEEKLNLKYIILTHAHIDHTLCVEELKAACGGKVVIHEEDAPLLGNSLLNCSVFFGVESSLREADICVKDGDILEAGGIKMSILHTPGHTPGSMCIMAQNCLFTGDTLFRLGAGRTDLGAGDFNVLMRSLQRLMELDDSMIVYPGHGPATDIGYERRYNMQIV